MLDLSQSFVKESQAGRKFVHCIFPRKVLKQPLSQINLFFCGKFALMHCRCAAAISILSWTAELMYHLSEDITFVSITNYKMIK